MTHLHAVQIFPTASYNVIQHVIGANTDILGVTSAAAWNGAPSSWSVVTMATPDARPAHGSRCHIHAAPPRCSYCTTRCTIKLSNQSYHLGSPPQTSQWLFFIQILALTSYKFVKLTISWYCTISNVVHLLVPTHGSASYGPTVVPTRRTTHHHLRNASTDAVLSSWNC